MYIEKTIFIILLYKGLKLEFDSKLLKTLKITNI